MARWTIIAIAIVLTGWAAWYPTVDLTHQMDEVKSELATARKTLAEHDRRLVAAKHHLHDVLSKNLSPSLLQTTGVLLGAEFRGEMQANAMMANRTRGDFPISEDLIETINLIDAKNGHALYIQGEIDRLARTHDLGHENFMLYLQEEAMEPHARDADTSLAACRTARGYCRQRTAWIAPISATGLCQIAAGTWHSSERIHTWLYLAFIAGSIARS